MVGYIAASLDKMGIAQYHKAILLFRRGALPWGQCFIKRTSGTAAGFYCLTGLRAVVFDSFGMEVLSYPPELPLYCRLIRSVPNGKTGCYLCDQAACRKATRQKQTVIYPCHAGLIEVITPIQINDAVVGFCY